VNSNQAIAHERADGIDIFAIIRLMWRYKYLIGFMSIVGALLAVYLALTARELFRAEAVVTVVHENGLSDQQGLGGQLGGLASLAGLTPGGTEDAGTQGVLASRHLIEEFIKRYNLMPLLMPKPGPRSTLWFAVKRFQEHVALIHVDQEKGLTTVSMDWFDPATAAKWTNDFIALANELLRTRAIEDATRNVAFLNAQTQRTQSVEIQHSLNNLIESETKKLMLASGRTDYAFQTIDPAVPPGIRHSPKRALLVVSGTALGFFLGCIIAFGYDAFRRRKSIQ
jgi:uncharacterized protein involved in exopolysaccharide biosynthesis